MLRRLTALALVTAALMAVTSSPAQASWYIRTRVAVCHFFPGYLCTQAMAVVRCETGGTFSPWAVNGQYVNIFQMGLHERETFGWHVRGSSVWLAARAARHYFNYERRRGIYGWSPWSCRP